MDQDQVYEIKFHGKPVNIFPLKNSKIVKIKENNKTKEIFCLIKGLATKMAAPKNRDKNSGITKSEMGINPLNISSCVKDIEIQ